MHPLCPVLALQAYLDRTSYFRLAEQLFVCFGGHTKGLPLSKQWLSHWIVEAIALTNASKYESCPWGVCTHSTRSVASSWAWAKGMLIQDICLVAGWSSQNTFDRFFNLEILSFTLLVLSVQWDDYCSCIGCCLHLATPPWWAGWFWLGPVGFV